MPDLFDLQPRAQTPELSREEVVNMASRLAVHSCAELESISGFSWKIDPVDKGTLIDESKVFGPNQEFVINRYRTEPTATMPGVRLAIERTFDFPSPGQGSTSIVIDSYHYKQMKSGKQKIIVDEGTRVYISGFVNNYMSTADLKRFLKPWHWTPWDLYDYLSLAAMQKRGRKILARIRPYLIAD